MNRIHAVVWNARLGLWTAVAETARRNGKGSTAATVVAGGALLGALLAAPAAWGQAVPSVTVSSGNTNAYVAGNGVTVVNIDKANAAGLSHNRYHQYNVDPKGLVLNNGDSSQMARQSQLAGQVMANMNLSGPARVILNEVVSNNRSTLAGFTEVLGGRADVVLANPYGITCSGCGFIATDRVTLTTGLPFVRPDGTLGGFDVGGGDILVNGGGLNATAQQILDLVTRSVRLDAPINGLDVAITAGANRWDYGTRSATGAAAATGTVPGYSIDSSALGGMYANRIRLTSTEAGVGVRMLADAAASADDFTLSSAGTVEVRGRISAQRNLALDSASASAQALALTEASLTSGQDLALRAQAGGVSLAGGALVAGRDLAVDAATLLDAAGAVGVADANRRHAGGSLVLAAAGDALLAGTIWDAAGAWKGDFGSLALGSGSQLGAGSALEVTTAGNLDLGAAALVASGNLALTSGGALTTAAAAGQGVRSTAGGVAMTAAGGLTNAGAVSADVGATVLRAGGTVSNSGRVHAGTTLDIADAAGGASQSVSNSGQLLADGALAIQGAALANTAAGWIQAGSGSTLVAGSLVNAGTLLLSQQATANDQVTVTGTLTNTGTLQSAGAATLAAAAVDNRGTMLAAGDLSATSAGALQNTGIGAVLQAGGQLAVQGASVANEGRLRGASLALTAGSGLANSGTASADTGAATMRVGGTFTNSGQIAAGTSLDIADAAGAGTQALANSGNLLAGGALLVKAAAVTNSAGGWMQGTTGTSLQAASLDNAGTLLLSQQGSAADELSVAGLLANSGTIQGAGSASVSAGVIENSANLVAAGNLVVNSAGALTNAASAVLQSGQQLTLAVDSAANDGTVKAAVLQLTAANGLANAGTLVADSGAATLRVGGTLANSGRLQAADALDIADAAGGASEDVSNSGTLVAGAELKIKSDQLGNTASGWMQGAGAGATLQAASLDNAGTLLLSQQATASDSVTIAGALGNSGTLQSGGDVMLAAGSIANTARLLAAGDLDATATGTFANGASGVTQAGQRLALQAATHTNAAGGKVLGGTVQLTGGSLANAGTIDAGAGGGTVDSTGTLTNQAGAVLALGTGGGSAGTVRAAGVVNHGLVESDGSLALHLGTGGYDGSGSLRSGGNLSLQGQAGATYTANIAGTVDSGGLLGVSGNAGSAFKLAANAVAHGDTVNIATGTLQLANGSGAYDAATNTTQATALTSQGAMTVNVGSLALDGAYSRILGAREGTATTSITSSSALANNGLVFSGRDLQVSAPAISTGTQAAFVALHDLSLSATAGNLSNSGALYAGRALTATANAGTLTNVGSMASAVGTIDAAGPITLSARTVLNNSLVTGAGDVTISADHIRNEVVGGGAREWYMSSSWNVYTGTDYSGWVVADAKEYQYDRYVHHQTWRQRYVGGAVPGARPQILGGQGVGTVRLAFTQTGTNLGGLISGHNVQLVGTGAGASFTNDDLSLTQDNYERRFYNLTGWLGVVDHAVKSPDQEFHWDGAMYKASSSTLSSIGAGVFANNLTATGFALTNNGSTMPAASMPRSGAAQTAALGAVPNSSTRSQAVSAAPAPTTAATSGPVSATAVAGATPVSPATFIAGNAAAGVSGTSFGGIALVLPANPNGLFVIARAPQSRYLVETNPLYGAGNTSVGSDFLARMLGYDPDLVAKRLGDASYEAFLVKQQLVAQTGNAVLAGYNGQAAQMQGLMESAATQSSALRLTFGKALTKEQQAALKSDIVWMVATEVNGQVVLAPVVYLSPQTRNDIAKGAVILASTAEMNLTSLTNTGGTIGGTQSLTVVSAGDITNVSGTLRGGDVSLTSTGGSIVNRTAATGSGDDKDYVTVIGKTAGIEATGNLKLDAAKDIENRGANVSAGGDASLVAAGDVTFDTIENRNTATSTTAIEVDGARGSSTTTTSTVQQVKSGLTVGGNLGTRAGNDITLAGTDAKVGGNADLQAGGDLNIVARENSKTTHTESKAQGFGMGGALYGSSETTSDSESIRNVGSTLQVGGNANLTAKNDITLQGSDVDVKGSGSVSATNVNVLAGRNYDASTTTTKTTAVGKVMDSGSSGASRAGTKTASSSKDGKVQASAEGSAEAGHTASGGLALYTSTETTTTDTDLRHVGSNLNFGGDLTVNAKNDLTLQGSSVSGGGNVAVNATNVNLLAAEDKKTSSTTSTTTTVGFMGSTENKADASGGASASAYGGKGTPNAKAGAGGEANASTENKLALYQGSKSSESTLDTTHQGSAIQSGGAMTINASNNLTVQGSDLASGGDMALNARDMRFEAVNDTHTTTRSSETTSVGLYADGSASASAGGGANAGIGAMAGGSASAEVKGEVGLYGEHNKSGSVEGSTTARTSGITSGGNLTRTATNSITDVGTRAEVKGDLTQSAQTITSLAAADTTFSSSSSEDIGVRVGAYGEASVSAQGQAGVGPKPGGQASVAPGYGAGIRASAEYGKENASSSSSTAVVSSFKVGGSVTSTSTGATRMEGTQIEAGKNVTLNAGSLEYTAARNTSSSSSDKVTGGGSVGVDIVNKSASVSGEGGNESSSERTSTAVVGGIKAGGGVSVTSQGDARFEGTQIESGGSTAVKAGGSLRFDAAKDTSESSSSGVSASAGITAGKKEGSGNVAVGYEKGSSSSSKDVVASIKSGGGITAQSGGDTTLVGTTLAAQGDVSVNATGNLNVEAAHETKSGDSMHVDVSGAGGKQGVTGKKYASTGEANAGGGFKKSASDTATGATITSGGGNVNLSSGKDTTLVGTQVQAKGQTTVAAGGTVTQKAAVSTSSSSSAEVSASASGGSMQPVKKKGAGSTGGTGGPNKKKNGAVGSGILEVETTSDSSSSSQEVSLGGGQGVVVSQGGNSAKPQVRAAVSLPMEGRSTSRGAKVVAKTADGKPLPSWLKFDAKTGSFTGTPPAGYKGDLKVNVFIPMADGTTQTRSVSFGK